MSKLSSCLRALPPNATRVIVVMCKDGVDNELASTLGSELWADSPERTVVVVPEATVCLALSQYVKAKDRGTTSGQLEKNVFKYARVSRRR